MIIDGDEEVVDTPRPVIVVEHEEVESLPEVIVVEEEESGRLLSVSVEVAIVDEENTPLIEAEPEIVAVELEAEPEIVAHYGQDVL